MQAKSENCADLPEEVRGEDDLLTGEEWKLFQTRGEIQFPCYGQTRLHIFSERVHAENGSTTYTGLHLVPNQIPATDLLISMDPIGQQY